MNNQDQVSGVFYTTTDYSRFKKLLGNREVTEQRIAAIVDSMKRRGYITSPILVNEHFEIIDGQGRFQAEKQLGLPVEYIVQPGLTVEDCISMNIKMKNWDIRDYIGSYADRGVQDYVRLKALIAEFPSISISSIGGMARKNLSAGNANDAIRTGRFSLDKKDMPELRETLRFIEEVQKQTGSLTGSNCEFAIGYCYRTPGCDTERLKKVLCENHREISVPRRTADVIDRIDEKYNYGRRESKRILFTVAYKRDCRASNAAYASRWEKATNPIRPTASPAP